MKRVSMFFVVLIIVSGWVSVADAQDVWMPDDALAAVVRDELGLAPNAPITRQAMQGLTSLDGQSYRIREITGQSGQIENLTGLEHATRLRRLWLNNNRIRDIVILSRLIQLEELQIWNNAIRDIGPLARLRHLRVLAIADNPIDDFEPLAGLARLRDLVVSVRRISDLHRNIDLARLEFLSIWGSGDEINDLRLLSRMTQLRGLEIRRVQISDFGFVSGLTQLESLDFSSNGISDLSPFSGLTRLSRLTLRDNEVSNLSPLSVLTRLTSLDLSYNDIRDVSPLASLVNLEYLYLQENPIQDVSPLSVLTRLKSLSLWRNQVSDLKSLSVLTRLTWLDLRYNDIRDVSPLASLVNLEYLYLRDNLIQDASPLSVLTKLRDVDIDIPEPPRGATTEPVATGNVVIRDANLAKAVRKALGLGTNAPISKQRLRGLTRLDARHSQIKNLTGLEHATRLEFLELRDNQISNIRPLVNLKRLNELILENNRVSDIRPLANMKQLTWLLIGKNPISNFTPLTNLTELRGLSFWGNDVSDVTLFAGLTKLTHLWLGSNKISNITPLADLVNLKVLSLHDNQIRDVSPLTGLANLERLELRNNPVRDTSPLASLTKLHDVDIEIHQQSVPTTGTELAIVQPRGLARSQFTIKPGAFVILVHRGKPSITGGIDFNDYSYIEHKNPQAPKSPDFPNLAPFFQEGGRIELVSHATINPLPRDSGEARFGDVIITEIMWGLDGQSPAKQYIELYNASAHTYTFTDADLSFRFSKISEVPLPDGTFAPSHNPNVRVKVIDRVSNEGWRVPGKNGDVSQNKPLVSMYRTIDYTTGDVPDGTLASSWKASTGRVNLRPPSYGTPGAKHLPPVPVVSVGASERPPMYWINIRRGTLHRLVGDEVENLVSSVRNATGFAVDVADGKLYWSEKTSDRTGRIRRANLDGTGVQLVKNLTSVPHGIALDAAGGRIYLTNAWGKIQRLDVDGSNFQPNLITGLDAPSGIALDISDGKVYWTEMQGRVRRANLDGSNIQNLPAGPGEPMNITVSSSTVYWTVKTGEERGEIRFTNLTGTLNVATYVEFNEGFPIGLAVDPVEEKLYWTTSRDKIGRGDIDESTFQPNFGTGFDAPGALALSVEPPLVVETPEAATTDAVVSVSPASVVSPAISEQLTLNLSIMGGEAVAGYQLTLQFDPTALRYVGSSNGDYLPDGSFFVQPVVNRDRVELASSTLSGVSNGDGTLATITFEVLTMKVSTITLSETLLSDSQGNTFRPQIEGGEVTEPPKLKGDVNSDGMVNIQDLVLVASNFGETGENAADVNGDGVVNIADLVLVAGALGTAAAAPSLHPQLLEIFTAAEVQHWLTQAHGLNLTDITSQRGILLLEHLLAALIPKETSLLPNYPNPFNPETWIPYQLVKSGDVKITIYDARGMVVRRLELGYCQAGYYTNRSRAAYWDGRNDLGEPVASGVYFYQLETNTVSMLRKMVTLK